LYRYATAWYSGIVIDDDALDVINSEAIDLICSYSDSIFAT